jgi:hypothetical protein
LIILRAPIGNRVTNQAFTWVLLHPCAGLLAALIDGKKLRTNGKGQLFRIDVKLLFLFAPKAIRRMAKHKHGCKQGNVGC